MLRGFYTAASGMYTQEKKLNAYGNNISNASTAGFKKDNLISGTFGEHIATRMDAYQEAQNTAIGTGVYMQVVDEKYTSYEQGGFEETGRPMDIAIQGNGFFVIANEEGDESLTRDGQFSLDEEGYLVLPGFGRVQGEGGDIQLGTSSIGIDRYGNIYVTDPDDPENPAELVDRLAIALVEDYTALERLPSGLFAAGEYDLADDETAEMRIRQGNVERSNVNVAEEMTRIMASQRALQGCSQIVRMYDELSDKTNSQISRV